MAKKGKGSGGSIDFKVTASGLNKVDKDAKKAGQSFNTLDKNSRSTDRAMKGVSNMSSNTTKNFSKMSQGITGGLVPAYATLAAQLFALDALFRFFREAADFRVLQQGQELFAASTGRAMRTLSKDIQAATSAQITFKEASQSAAIGLAAGLSPTQLNELGKAARTVSVALGRDTTDSFNRLIRGVTKAEPELLDELGIILRLEEATTRYAASLGLNKNQLTTFQKSQAVANEVLRQSEERYGAIADLIGDDSVNQLNKLMVAFDEVMNRIRLAIAPLAEFFGTFLTENIESATAAIGVFAASISGGLIRGAMPVINYGKAGQQAAKVAGAGDLQVTKLMNKDRIKRLSTPGAATDADIAAYQKAVKAKESIMIKFENNTRREHERTVNILKAQRQRMIADASTGFERMKNNFKADLYEMQAEHGRVMGTMKFAGMQFGKVMGGIMSAIGFIGIAVMIFQMGKQIFNMFKKVDERMEKIKEETAEMANQFNSLADELSKTALFVQAGVFKTFEEEIKAAGGAFQSADLPAKFMEVRKAIGRLGPNSEEVQDLVGGLHSILRNLGDVSGNPIFKDFARQILIDPQQALVTTTAIEEISDAYIRQGNAVTALVRAQANYDKQINAFNQKIAKIPYQNVIMSLQTIASNLAILRQGTEEGSADQARLNLEFEKTIMRLEAFKNLYRAATVRTLAFKEAQRQALGTMTALAGEKSSLEKQMKIAKQTHDILKTLEDIEAARTISTTASSDLQRETAEIALEIAEKDLQIKKEQMALMMAAQNDFLMMAKKMTDEFYSGLGKEFGKLFRGEGFSTKELGKKMAQTMSDELGRMLAERIQRIAFTGTFLDPEVQKKKYLSAVEETLGEAGTNHANNLSTQIDAAGQTQAENVNEGIDTGGVNAANTIKAAMQEAANDHASLLVQAQTMQLRSDQIDAEARYNQSKAEVERLQGIVDGTSLTEMMANYAHTVQNRVFDVGQMLQNIGQTEIGYTSGMHRAEGNYFGKMISDAVSEASFSEPAYEGRYYHSISGIHMNRGEFTRQAIRDVLQTDFTDPDAMTAAHDEFMSKFSSAEGKKVLEILRGTPLANIIDMIDEMPETAARMSNTKRDIEDYAATQASANVALEEELVIMEKFKQELDEVNKVLERFNIEPIKIDDYVDDDGTFKDTPLMKGGGTSDSDKNKKTPKGLAAFTADTEQLFPSMMDALEDDGFGESVLEFSTVITQFAALTAQGLSLAGKQEEAADIMLEVAKIQMALAVGEFATKIGLVGRYGGSFKGGMKSFMYGGYTHGGVTDGPEAGYNVRMHGREAIVPLGNDRSIPVKMQGGTGTNNVNVSVNIDQSGQSQSLVTGDGARELGKTIAAIATDTIAKEQRAGGLLSNI
jgi:hypothetical protein